jgi:hypothetical protein
MPTLKDFLPIILGPLPDGTDMTNEDLDNMRAAICTRKPATRQAKHAPINTQNTDTRKKS